MTQQYFPFTFFCAGYCALEITHLGRALEIKHLGHQAKLFNTSETNMIGKTKHFEESVLLLILSLIKPAQFS